MRKRLLKSLVILMTIFTLSGCGNKNENVVVTDNTPTMTEGTDTVEETKNTEEVVATEAPTSEPTEEAKVTEAPVVETEAPTEAPKVTETPDKVEVTEAPEITKAPEEAEATKEPAKETVAPTEAPKGTEAPAETPKPTDTPKPTEAPTPKPTEAPTPTEAPATPEPTPEPVCDHELENKTIKEPTCTEFGLEETVCSKCGYSWGTSKMNMVDHNFVNGVCTICQDTDETAHKHEWTLTSVTNAPTCGMAGFGAYECSSCGKTQGMEIPPTGQHTYTLLWQGCGHMESEYQCSVCYQFHNVIDSSCVNTDGDEVCDKCGSMMN